MQLVDFVRAYSEARDIADGTADQLRYAVRALERYNGSPVGTRQLSAQLLNSWIAERIKANIARKTIAVQRGALLSLWKDAARQGLAPPLAEVRLVRVPKTIPQAWLPCEFAALLANVETLTGAFPCGVPRKLLVRALALVGYYSGLRPSDLLALRSIDVLAECSLVVRQAKTGEPIKIAIPDDAMQAILATNPETRERVFPLSRKNLWYWFRKIRGSKGSPKWLRRTGATRCEQQQPGSAMAYLGHLTPGLAYRHYVDMRQISDTKPLPPKP